MSDLAILLKYLENLWMTPEVKEAYRRLCEQEFKK